MRVEILHLSCCCLVQRTAALEQDHAGLGHGPRREGQALRIEVVHPRLRCAAQRLDDLGQEMLVLVVAHRVMEEFCTLESRISAAAPSTENCRSRARPRRSWSWPKA